MMSEQNHKNTKERCVAQRGRNYKGEPQHLEIRPDDGKTNCLTTVAKENLIMRLPLETNKAERKGEHRGEKSLARLRKNMRDTDGKSHTFLALSCKGAQANGMSLVKENLTASRRKSVRTPKVMTRNGTPVNDGNKSNALCVGGNGAGNNSQTVCVQETPCRIRRLTPAECARLQTVPDWYKWNVSETQQYKMLGNGWTVEIIRHILSFLPQNMIKKRTTTIK